MGRIILRIQNPFMVGITIFVLGRPPFECSLRVDFLRTRLAPGNEVSGLLRLRRTDVHVRPFHAQAQVNRRPHYDRCLYRYGTGGCLPAIRCRYCNRRRAGLHARHLARRRNRRHIDVTARPVYRLVRRILRAHNRNQLVFMSFHNRQFRLAHADTCHAHGCRRTFAGVNCHTCRAHFAAFHTGRGDGHQPGADTCHHPALAHRRHRFIPALPCHTLVARRARINRRRQRNRLAHLDPGISRAHTHSRHPYFRRFARTVFFPAFAAGVQCQDTGQCRQHQPRHFSCSFHILICLLVCFHSYLLVSILTCDPSPYCNLSRQNRK